MEHVRGRGCDLSSFCSLEKLASSGGRSNLHLQIFPIVSEQKWHKLVNDTAEGVGAAESFKQLNASDWNPMELN